MIRELRLFAIGAALAGWSAPLPAAAADAATSVMIQATLQSPFNYEEALAHLDEYYREQVGKSGAEALPALAPLQHFDVWKETWISFSPAGSRTLVVLRRQAEPNLIRLTKSQIFELSGRLGVTDVPLFRESPPLESATADVFAARRDLTQAIAKANSNLRPLASWRHAALFVSAAPLMMVSLANSAASGLSRLTVTAPVKSDAQRLLAQLTAASNVPRLCALIDETNAIADELHKDAVDQAYQEMLRAATVIVTRTDGTSLVEERLRAAPEMQKRLANARAMYQVKYRVPSGAHKIALDWSVLDDYSRETAQFSKARPLAHLTQPDAHPNGVLTARFKIEPLPAGAHRLRLEAETAPGKLDLIDERVFWYDGKRFQQVE